MGLVLTPLRRVDLDHVELAVLPIPVEDALHARPPTPLHAPPARPGAAHADLRDPRDVDVRPIDARIPSSRAPTSLLHLLLRPHRPPIISERSMLLFLPAGGLALRRRRPLLAGGVLWGRHRIHHRGWLVEGAGASAVAAAGAPRM